MLLNLFSAPILISTQDHHDGIELELERPFRVGQFRPDGTLDELPSKRESGRAPTNGNPPHSAKIFPVTTIAERVAQRASTRTEINRTAVPDESAADTAFPVRKMGAQSSIGRDLRFVRIRESGCSNRSLKSR